MSDIIERIYFDSVPTSANADPTRIPRLEYLLTILLRSCFKTTLSESEPWDFNLSKLGSKMDEFVNIVD